MNVTFRNIQSSAGCPWGYVHKQYRDTVEKEKNIGKVRKRQFSKICKYCNNTYLFSFLF